jgi:aminoglycoside phosphotransferase (APT) family kinase protein
MLDDRRLNEATGGPSARTIPVAQRLQFDSAAIERYLGARIEGLRGPLQVEQFEGGQSNPTYLLTGAGGRRFVLRRKPPGKLLSSAHAVDRSASAQALDADRRARPMAEIGWAYVEGITRRQS